MADKCQECGEEFKTQLDGTVRCKNGHEKKKTAGHYSFPLGDSSGGYFKKRGV